ncbi:hypothetical protein ABG768_021733 [Culter alburnus]|uniref:CTCK domain-containing protein n=1 Tax=Culter alburnus TaxID=194366 RepID=A0AAW2ATT1_CULAL
MCKGEWVLAHLIYYLWKSFIIIIIIIINWWLLKKSQVSQEDCRSRTVINRFCYGQSNFFFIPRHVKKEQESFQSCAFCRPNRFTSLTVELDCYRKIQSVKQCHCMSVSVSKSGNSERTMLRHLLLI